MWNIAVKAVFPGKKKPVWAPASFKGTGDAKGIMAKTEVWK